MSSRTAALITSAALLAACSEDAEAPDPCAGDGAPVLGCLCLSDDDCPTRTGFHLTAEQAGLDAPRDFDALSIHLAADRYRPRTRRVDMGSPQAPKPPLDLLVLAEGKKGTEVDVQVSAFVCRSSPTQGALSAAELESCTRVVQRLVGSSGRAPKTVKLPKEHEIKELALTVTAVEGF